MKLLEPGRIGKMEVKNRIVMAAMGCHGLHEPDGDWGERYMAYFGARAAGGVGLITTETTFVSKALEPFTKDLFSVASDKHISSMKCLAKLLHSYDCRLSIQLTAGFGRVIAPPVVPEGVRPVSASENPNYFLPDDPGYISRAITTEEAEALAQSFGYAAMRCREAGADCVELHGHEGYLMDQFMTALWNRRNDKYGGSCEKRLTFAREAIAAIRRDAGEDFPIIYRYGLTHYLEGGRDEEEGLWIAGELEKMGVSALHVDAGCYESPWWPHPPQYQPEGCLVHIAEKVKKVSSLPVIAVGRLHYPEVAEKVLVENKADFIAIGRGLLSEPEWVNKVKSNKIAEIRPCLGCHEGCLWQMIIQQPTSCSLNPACGHEIEWRLTPLKTKKSLLIVGGGPGGIEAARVGAQRGFDVTLWEASDRLGGNLLPASKPAFKHDIFDYINYLNNLCQYLSAKIVLNKEATDADIKKFNADYVILATGSQMETPPFENSNILTVIDVLKGKMPQGKKVLVIGAGVYGCETAVYLAQQGKEVTITTRRDDDALAADLFDHNNRLKLLLMIEEAGINVISGVVPLRTENGGILVSQDGSEKKITADSFVFAGRLFPKNNLSKFFKDSKNVFSIGDCVKPESIMSAVWGGFNTVREIENA